MAIEKYDDTKDGQLLANQESDMADEVRDSKFSKGQSKRIWNELYKVIHANSKFYEFLVIKLYRLLIHLMLFYMFSTPAILWVPDVRM